MLCVIAMETGQVGSLPLMSVQNEVQKEGPLCLLQLCEATLLKKKNGGGGKWCLKKLAVEQGRHELKK